MSKLLLGRRWALVLMASLVPSLAAAQAPTASRDFARGEQVPSFDADSATSGARERVDYAGTTVVLFFLSSCPACHRQIPEWNKAYARRGEGVRVVGVLLDREPPGFFAVNKIDFPVVRAPGGTFRQSYRIRQVPTTLRVSAGGKVDDVSVGSTDPIRLGQLFRR